SGAGGKQHALDGGRVLAAMRQDGRGVVAGLAAAQDGAGAAGGGARGVSASLHAGSLLLIGNPESPSPHRVAASMRKNEREGRGFWSRLPACEGRKSRSSDWA